MSIVLPCYNESRNIPVIVERISKFWPRINFELIMVNNGSTDDTDRVLKDLTANNEFLRTVTVKENIGYGHGIMTGLQEARADILTYSHADNQTPPEDIFRAFDMLKTNGLNPKETLIKGLRTNRRKNEQIFTKGLDRISSLMLGYKMYDVNGQPKLFHRNLLDNMTTPLTDFSFDVYVMYKAFQNGLQIRTFPVDFGQRLHGESKSAPSPLKKFKTILGYLRNILLMTFKNTSDRNNIIKQFVRFCVVGGFGATLNYTLFYLFFKALSTNYMLSSIIGFFGSGAVIFLFSRQWTFNISHGHIPKQFLKLIFLALLSLVANCLTVYLLTDLVLLKPEISQLFAMTITTIINFFGSKLWVFKHPHP